MIFCYRMRRACDNSWESNAWMFDDDFEWRRFHNSGHGDGDKPPGGRRNYGGVGFSRQLLASKHDPLYLRVMNIMVHSTK